MEKGEAEKLPVQKHCFSLNHAARTDFNTPFHICILIKLKALILHSLAHNSNHFTGRLFHSHRKWRSPQVLTVFVG